MAYSVFAVANAFIELSIRDEIKNLTNMKKSYGTPYEKLDKNLKKSYETPYEKT